MQIVQSIQAAWFACCRRRSPAAAPSAASSRPSARVCSPAASRRDSSSTESTPLLSALADRTVRTLEVRRPHGLDSDMLTRVREGDAHLVAWRRQGDALTQAWMDPGPPRTHDLICLLEAARLSCQAYQPEAAHCILQWLPHWMAPVLRLDFREGDLQNLSDPEKLAVGQAFDALFAGLQLRSGEGVRIHRTLVAVMVVDPQGAKLLGPVLKICRCFLQNFNRHEALAASRERQALLNLHGSVDRALRAEWAAGRWSAQKQEMAIMLRDVAAADMPDRQFDWRLPIRSEKIAAW